MSSAGEVGRRSASAGNSPRYPQLYSRVGSPTNTGPLDTEDIPDVLEHYWRQLVLPFDPALADEAANTVTRITGGTFRLIERLDRAGEFRTNGTRKAILGGIP